MALAPNATMSKFGWPATRIAEVGGWAVMLRPQQPTLGALVVASTEPVGAFGALSAQAFADLARVTAGVEAMLAAAVGYDKINWLMLMMVDADVHFHVLPRYAGARAAEGLSVEDHGWPGPPALGRFETPDAATAARLVARLEARWRA